MQPEIVVPMHVVRKLRLQLAGRGERLAVDELRLQYLVRRLVDRVVVGAALLGERPLDAEDLEHPVDLGVVELRAAIGMKNLDVGYGELFTWYRAQAPYRAATATPPPLALFRYRILTRRKPPGTTT